jgi:opacity protein-like surface antigen
MRRTLLVSVFGLALLPAAMAAQVCRGFPALTGSSNGHVGVGVSFFENGKGYGGEVTFGGPLFVMGFFNYIDPDDTSLSLKVVGAGVGYEAAAGSQISVCPGVTASYGFGLEVFGVDFTTIQVTPGVALGLTSNVSSTVSVTPFAEGALVYSRVEADAGPLGDASGDNWSGLLNLGLGLGFNDRLTIRPAASIPLAIDEDEQGGDTVFTVIVAIGIGG